MTIAITPVFLTGTGDLSKGISRNAPTKPIFYVASRGHQADIGGITPGSMPPHSNEIVEEGILLDNFLLVANGNFREAAVREILSNHTYPARNIEQK